MGTVLTEVVIAFPHDYAKYVYWNSRSQYLIILYSLTIKLMFYYEFSTFDSLPPNCPKTWCEIILNTRLFQWRCNVILYLSYLTMMTGHLSTVIHYLHIMFSISNMSINLNQTVLFFQDEKIYLFLTLITFLLGCTESEVNHYSLFRALGEEITVLWICPNRGGSLDPIFCTECIP